MGWFDDVHDTMAGLEEGTPEEVAEKISHLLDATAKDTYRKDWKDRYMGLCMLSNVMRSSFDEYRQAVAPLEDKASDAAKKILQKIDSDRHIKRWFFDDSEKELIKSWASGDVDRTQNYEFQPDSHRVWEITDVTVELVGLLQDAVFVRITMNNTKTDETREHELNLEVDIETLLSRQTGALSIYEFEKSDVKNWELEGTGTVKSRGEVGERYPYVELKVPFKLETNDDTLELNLECYIGLVPGTAEVKRSGSWTAYRR